MRPDDAIAEHARALGIEVVRFGDDRGDATVVALPPPAPALLHDVWVHPEHRRAGVARELLGKVLAWADRHQRALQLVAAEEKGTVPLDRLVAFYESLGFELTEWLLPTEAGMALAVEALGCDPDDSYREPRPVMVRPASVCRHCGERLRRRQTPLGGRYRWERLDTPDTATLGSGSECPRNGRGHEPPVVHKSLTDALAATDKP